MDDSELLATVWLSSSELKHRAEENGLVYLTGPFTNNEKAKVQKFLDTYQNTRGLTKEDVTDIVNASGKLARAKHGSFFKEVALSVPGRPLRSVHSYLRRAFHPLARKGTWTREEDEELRAAFLQHGPQWQKVSEVVERSANDCKDRWRNHLEQAPTKKRGFWSAEDADKLKQIVLEVAEISGMALEDTAQGIPWTTVAIKMGNERTPPQCRIKWQVLRR